MANTDLWFRQTPASGASVDMVFGDDDAPPRSAVDLRISGQITGLRGHMVVRRAVFLQAAGGITGLHGHVRVAYSLNVERPIVGHVRQGWQFALPLSGAGAARYEQAESVSGIHRALWQDGSLLEGVFLSAFQQAARWASLARQGWQEAVPLGSAPIR